MTRQQEDIKTRAAWERLKNGEYSFDSYAEVADQIQKAREQAEASRDAIEKSSYEALMEDIAAAKASNIGYTDAELDKLYEDGVEKIKKSLEEEEIKNKRDERDVILGWMQGAVGNVVKSYSGVTDDDMAEIQRYFQLMLSNPDGMMDRASMGDLFRGMDSNDPDNQHSGLLLDYTFKALEDIEKQFGFDFVDKWAELNDEIGDTGYTLDDFFDTYNQAIDEMTVLDVDDIIPSLEELKETPEEYAKYMSAWAAAQSYSVTIEGDFDEEGFERRFNNFLSQKGLKPLQFQPSNYVSASTLQQSNSNTNIQLNVNIDEGNRTVTASDGVTTNTTWKKDNMMDNGGGR